MAQLGLQWSCLGAGLAAQRHCLSRGSRCLPFPGAAFLTNQEHRTSVPALMPSSSEDQRCGSPVGHPCPPRADLIAVYSAWAPLLFFVSSPGAPQRPRGKSICWLDKDMSGRSGFPVINRAQRATCFYRFLTIFFFLWRNFYKWNQVSSSQRTWYSPTERKRDFLRIL